MDHGLDGAGGVDDAEGAADEKDVEHDVGGFQKPLGEGQEYLGDPRRVGLDMVEGIRIDDLAALELDAVEGPGRDEVGGDRREHDEAEEQGEGVWDAGLHVVRPQNSAAVSA